MKKAKWEYADLCMCLPDLDFICPGCRREGKTAPSLSPLLAESEGDPPEPPPETVEESDGFENHSGADLIDNQACRELVGDKCPWNPDDIPALHRGYGHRLADQDGGTGREWVTPAADYEATFIEAVRVLFEVEEPPS
jgi:hypothetical protein